MFPIDLVGGWATPLKKIWVRQLWWFFPIYGKNVPTQQPAILHWAWLKIFRSHNLGLTDPGFCSKVNRSMAIIGINKNGDFFLSLPTFLRSKHFFLIFSFFGGLSLWYFPRFFFRYFPENSPTSWDTPVIPPPQRPACRAAVTMGRWAVRELADTAWCLDRLDHWGEQWNHQIMGRFWRYFFF